MFIRPCMQQLETRRRATRLQILDVPALEPEGCMAGYVGIGATNAVRKPWALSLRWRAVMEAYLPSFSMLVRIMYQPAKSGHSLSLLL
jgi:NADPH:quinone reductase-like Zn-dependent oxidoreductase